MEENKSSIGSIIGTIIIITLLVLGGLYFWGKRIEETRTLQSLNTEPETTTTVFDASANEAAVIKSVSPSDDLTSIEADLQNTKTTGLNSEVVATSTKQ